MAKRMMTGLIVLVFIASSLFFMSSCAKEQVVSSEEAAEAEEVKTGETEAYKEKEAERQAKLKELAEEQKFQDSLNQFNNENIYFDFDKSELKPEAQAVLQKKVDWLRDHPEWSVRIAGHCDERGSNEYNLALGQRRAHAAKQFLVARGISADRITTISYGEERPADPRHNPEAWAKNRRDEFTAIKK